MDRGSARVHQVQGRGCTSSPFRRPRRCGSRSSCTPRASAWPHSARRPSPAERGNGLEMPERAREWVTATTVGRTRPKGEAMSETPAHESTVGTKVVDSQGHAVGKVADVLYDDRTLQPRWVAINLGMLHRHQPLVPLQQPYVSDDGRLA